MDIEVHRNVKNMAALMKEHDLALTSAGRTVVELITMRVPSIVFVKTSKN